MPSLHLKIKEQFKDAVLLEHAQHGDETVVVNRESLIEILKFLRDDENFAMNVLIDLTVVDGLGMEWRPRYEVVYHVYSVAHNHRLRVKVQVEKKDAVVPTATDLWAIANWFEREAWDMFGVEFEGHPDMRRILMYDEFKGHPLRKDYAYNKRQPLIGPKN